jgi:hypothetical protein
MFTTEEREAAKASLHAKVLEVFANVKGEAKDAVVEIYDLLSSLVINGSKHGFVP